MVRCRLPRSDNHGPIGAAMHDLPTLIRQLIARRYGGSESRLAEVLEVNRSTVHRIVSGEKPLSLKAIDAWADALALDGQERADFIFAVEVANSPESIAKRLNALEALVERNHREALRAAAKWSRVVARLRAERAPRRPGR